MRSLLFFVCFHNRMSESVLSRRHLNKYEALNRPSLVNLHSLSEMHRHGFSQIWVGRGVGV